MKEFAKQLAEEFTDKEYAHAYMEGYAISRIAAQIHSIRKQRGWSQKELGKRANLTQEKISKIESADFDSLTLKTLRKFSEAFDVHLHISFVPFSQGILDVTNLSSKGLEVEPRAEDITRMRNHRILKVSNGEWRLIHTKASVVNKFVNCPVENARDEPGGTVINKEWQRLKFTDDGDRVACSHAVN